MRGRCIILFPVQVEGVVSSWPHKPYIKLGSNPRPATKMMKLTLKRLLLIQLIVCLLAWNTHLRMHTKDGDFGGYFHHKYGPIPCWYFHIIIGGKFRPILDISLPFSKSLRFDDLHGIAFYNEDVEVPIEDLSEYIWFKLW
jgi:hypothetical protein